MMNSVVKISEKNQITMPSWARKYLGIHGHRILKLSSGVKGTQKCINITAIPERTSISDIWDQIDQACRKVVNSAKRLVRAIKHWNE